MINKLFDDNNAQVSAEFILLIGALLIIVLIMINIYYTYLNDFTEEIQDNEVKNLIDEIDDLKNHL